MRNKQTMKRIMATTLVAIVVAIVVAFAGPAMAEPGPLKIAGDETAKRPEIEVVFALDTTGSMSGLIHAAKEKIWSIASSMTQARPAPNISIGLVAYRDRGDMYVTQRTPLTRDIDAVYEQLMQLEADGGGDGPESVNQALHEAVTEMNWTRKRGVYRVIFLVGDAPPHLDYQQDVHYEKSMKRAGRKGIFVNTVQCGQNSSTTPIWQEIARLGEGDFFKVNQSGGAVIASTPYDAEMAEISRKLDGTRLYYGKKDVRDRAEEKKKRSDKIASGASVAAQARRASFNTSASGRANFVGDSELLDDVLAGEVAVADIKEEELPVALKSMPKDKREVHVKAEIEKRAAYTKKLKDLTKKRQAFLKTEMEKSKAGGGLSQKVYDVVRKQATKEDIEFESAEAMH